MIRFYDGIPTFRNTIEETEHIDKQLHIHIETGPTKPTRIKITTFKHGDSPVSYHGLIWVIDIRQSKVYPIYSKEKGNRQDTQKRNKPPQRYNATQINQLSKFLDLEKE
jgi:hypothetical protein